MKKLIILLIFPILVLVSCKTPTSNDETAITNNSNTETFPTTSNTTEETNTNTASTPKDDDIKWEPTIHW